VQQALCGRTEQWPAARPDRQQRDVRVFGGLLQSARRAEPVDPAAFERDPAFSQAGLELVERL
jgi:hypothetical protein